MTARGLLASLAASPRPAGSAAEARARTLCATRLRERGYDVREEPFEYSTFPGRWATSLGGILAALLLPTAAVLGGRGDALGALILLVAAALLGAVGGFWLARHGVLTLPVGRARGTNLVARPTRGGSPAEPRVWLVAHLDSKSQPVPSLARAAGIVLTVIAWLAAIALAGTQLASDGAAGGAWGWVAGLGVLAALPVAASVVGARSPGALDNASGVASVLLAAERVPAGAPVGVLLTSAEELGLAGARAWVGNREPHERVPMLNCDGVDDDGELVLMYSGRRPDRLLAAAERAAAAVGVVTRARRLLPGILTDGVAFTDAGWEAVTVSRGTLRTLSRVHRPTDDLAHLTGAGVDETSRLLAALAADLAEG